MISEIQIVMGDITDLEVDAIVNSANKTLLGGGGVDGAIHRKAGEDLYKECLEQRKEEYKDGLPVGEACVTKGYNLDASFIIHTVSPVYSEKEDRSSILMDCFRNSLERADELKLETIAFPAIGTGFFNWPLNRCAEIAKEVIERYHSRHLIKVMVCLHEKKAYDVFKRVFEQ